MRLVPSLLVIAALAGPARADDTPAVRGSNLVKLQVAALNDHSNAAALFAKTFDDAVVITESDHAVAGADLEAAIGEMGGVLSPDIYDTLNKATIKKVVAGGNDDVVWQPYRITELLANDGGTWKVVAALLSAPRKGVDVPSSEPLAAIPSTTTPGIMATLVTDPIAIDTDLAEEPSVVLWGTSPSEAAVGAAKVRKLLKKWTKLSMTDRGRCPRGDDVDVWFVQANVNLAVKGKADPIRMRALLIAIPATDGWSVVAAHYSSP